MSTPSKNAALPAVAVTGKNFADAVPGDQCYCTIGQALHDSLGAMIRALELDSADATSIRVFPAELDYEPCAAFAFIGTKDGADYKVEALLEGAMAFKIAQLTDARQAGALHRHASQRPYSLQPTRLRVRKLQGPGRARQQAESPEALVRERATGAAQDSWSVQEAQDKVIKRLENQELPFELTPQLRELAREVAARSFSAKGTRGGYERKAPVKMKRGQRFYRS